MACGTNDSGVFAGGALALGGIPPFNVFVSEFSIAVAGIYAGKTWLVRFLFNFTHHRVSWIVFNGIKNCIRQTTR